MVAVRQLALLLCSMLALPVLSGCLSNDETIAPPALAAAPYLGYLPAEPDASLVLEQLEALIASGDVEIHARVVKPQGPGPFPVIAQFTPYTAGPGSPGQNAVLNNLLEPTVGCVSGVGGCEGGFDWQFVRRGYAFAYADVRGTGDSSGCLDLRGRMDIEDAGALTEWLGTQSWSNGNVGFIGASYPGSEAHIAGIANNPHLKAIVPIVASTSFYHYHHNDGVPYNGNHALGGTNAGYTQNALAPTSNPQLSNWGTRWVDEAQCPTFENVVNHGGLDQTGEYYDWWQERNIRGLVGEVKVPVLMGQGLADWNVKPDHIAHWFNDLGVASKTIIAGQWGHAYPYSVCEEDQTPASCDDRAPYGNWWQYVTAFFDTYLKGVDTGMFQGSTAWVQDSSGTFHRSDYFPLLPAERQEMVLHLTSDGKLGAVADLAEITMEWYACAEDQYNMGNGNLATVESTVAPCDTAGQTTELVFESEPLTESVIVSGVPLVDLTVESDQSFTHLVFLLEVLDADGNPVEREIREGVKLTPRENYGYLNPVFRNGLDSPEDVPTGTQYRVTIDGYTQEDVIKVGEKVRLTIRSDDQGRTIESFTTGTNAIVFGTDAVNSITLPLRPLALQGLRVSTEE